MAPRFPWVGVTEEASRRGEHIDTFRRWLKSVDAAAGGTILRHFSSTGKAGKLYVNVRALEKHAGPTAAERDATIQQMLGRIEELEAEARRSREFRRKAWLKLNKL